MSEIKDVPNGELKPELSELQLADIRIQKLETELKQARAEIARLKGTAGPHRKPGAAGQD